jgi:hypothetical protein
MPDKVNLFLGDCKTAIVIKAMYEYGGFTRFDRFLFTLATLKLAMENTVQCINSNKLDNQSFLTEDKMCWQTENKTWSQDSEDEDIDIEDIQEAEDNSDFVSEDQTLEQVKKEDQMSEDKSVANVNKKRSRPSFIFSLPTHFIFSKKTLIVQFVTINTLYSILHC